MRRVCSLWVVFTNLRLSFQEKSEKEISEIARIVLKFHNRKIPAVLGLSADQRPATITRLLIIRQIWRKKRFCWPISGPWKNISVKNQKTTFGHTGGGNRNGRQNTRCFKIKPLEWWFSIYKPVGKVFFRNMVLKCNVIKVYWKNSSPENLLIKQVNGSPLKPFM